MIGLKAESPATRSNPMLDDAQAEQTRQKNHTTKEKDIAKELCKRKTPNSNNIIK